MVSQEFTVKNPTGIHARPASMLVQLCSKMNDEISIVTEDGKTVNPKSILSVLMGGMSKGMKITVNAPDWVRGSYEGVALPGTKASDPPARLKFSVGTTG